jgi:hypothetical protein
MNRKPNAQRAGVLRTALYREVAEGLDRLGIGSLEVLNAEGKRYPWVGDYPDIYGRFPRGIARRVRAIELLLYLAHDGESTRIEDLDEAIAELHKVLPTAAIEVPEGVARKLARTLERERGIEKSQQPAPAPARSMWRHEIFLVGKAA